MKVVFEGSDQQIQNLMELYKMGDNDLPEIKDTYQTENLWCVDDAQNRFNCTKNEALELLYRALTNDATMEQIWFAIDVEGEEMGLTKKEEE